MDARERVPERHIDAGERHPDETLRAEQAEAARELLRDLGRREVSPSISGAMLRMRSAVGPSAAAV